MFEHLSTDTQIKARSASISELWTLRLVFAIFEKKVIFNVLFFLQSGPIFYVLSHKYSATKTQFVPSR